MMALASRIMLFALSTIMSVAGKSDLPFASLSKISIESHQVAYEPRVFFAFRTHRLQGLIELRDCGIRVCQLFCAMLYFSC